MTNYAVAQLINIAILIAFTFVLVLRTRARFKQRIRALEMQTPSAGQTSEQRRLILLTQIQSLQHELEELDRTQSPESHAAFRSSLPPS